MSLGTYIVRRLLALIGNIPKLLLQRTMKPDKYNEIALWANYRCFSLGHKIPVKFRWTLPLMLSRGSKSDFQYISRWGLFNHQSLREHRQKTFVTPSGFWPSRGWGNPLKKENSWRKSIFQMLYKALKISEKR